MLLGSIEHLPPERAGSFVEDLTKLAPWCCFRTIPGQGGDNHVNEMWQHHWARLFAKNGLEPWIMSTNDLVMVDVNLLSPEHTPIRT